MCYDPVREAVDTTSYIDESMATSPYIYRSGLVGESVKDVHRVLAIMVSQDRGQRSHLLTIVKHKRSVKCYASSHMTGL
jgi:hypothetical protein